MSPKHRLPAHLEKSSAANTVRIAKALVITIGLVLGAGYAAHLSIQAWEAGQKGVESAKILNEGQQIQGAARMYKADNAGPVITLKELQERGYLEKIPPGWVDSSTHTHARFYNLTPEMCARLNEKCGVCMSADTRNAHPDEVPASFGCLPALNMAFFKYD